MAIELTNTPEPNLWKIGRNVPWSVSWTGEQVFDLQQSQDFPGRMEVVQINEPSKGAPLFAVLHVTRHRAGMAEHFCHVCGKQTLKRDRYIFPVQSGSLVTLDDGSVRYAGNVPPVHWTCGKRARALCPHLSHTFAHPVPFPAEESLLLPRTDVIPGMEALAKTIPRGLKVVFTCYRLYGPRFSAR
ncbi:hypothetical protein, partial [Acidiphilium angustum]|uniref:hypothetical protein n=1 Tax=Acidiphilium angustum TaxID=523 RepID=UPI0012DE9DFC